MAESFSRWESDPLFSAAEVVQDSADRMDSAYRTLLHEQSLAREDTSDSKLLTLLQHHTRDLTTALETTKWQLEDFEREVNHAASSDSKSREIAILKHKQFISAIREQILLVESSLQANLREDYRRNSQWTNLNEEDNDMLTSFLSGGNFWKHSESCDSRNSSTRSFQDSSTDNDEIIELNPGKVGVLQVNGTKYAGNVYDSSRNHKTGDIGSHLNHKYDVKGDALSWGFGDQQKLDKPGASALEFDRLSSKCYSYQYGIRAATWGFLRNFWPANGTTGSFIKRRKDGEISDLENAEQGMPAYSSAAVSYQKGSISGFLIRATQFFKCLEFNRRRFRPSQYLISQKQFSSRCVVLMVAILTVIGFLGFGMAWMYIFDVFVSSTYP